MASTARLRVHRDLVLASAFSSVTATGPGYYGVSYKIGLGRQATDRPPRRLWNVGSNSSSRFPALRGPVAPGSTGADGAVRGVADAGQENAQQAVSALYEAHAVGLIRLAVVMPGDRPAAEDVVQEAFCGLYRRWGQLDDPGNAQRYVRSAVLNGSTIVQFPKWAGLTGNLTLTGGGRLIASAAYLTSGNGSVTGWLVGEFSARTGKAVHVLYRRSVHRGRQGMGPGTVWWASPSGQVLIASPARHGLGANQAYTGLAVFTGHRYIPLPWSGRIAEAAW
jgi:Sigma-70 region 2